MIDGALVEMPFWRRALERERYCLAEERIYVECLDPNYFFRAQLKKPKTPCGMLTYVTHYFYHTRLAHLTPFNSF